jgi:hypothetical protein
MIKSDANIYRELERVLKQTGETPLTCVDIYEQDAAIRDIVENTNRLSDYLGHMWRRGLLQRWFAAQSSTARARYAYTWKEADEGVVTPRKLADAKASYLTAVPTAKNKPNVTITESDGRVVLDFDQFTITVDRK